MKPGEIQIVERAFGPGAREAYGTLAGEPGATYFTPIVATPSGDGTMAATLRTRHGTVTGPRYWTREACERAVAYHVGAEREPRATYAVAFRWRDGCTVEPGYLDENAGELELAEVTDACASWHCEADLWLANGERAGWVHADGSYRLTRPAHASPDADYTPISVGFDLRRTGHTVQLPPGKWIVVRYCEGADERETAGPPGVVADVLRAAGYEVRP